MTRKDYVKIAKHFKREVEVCFDHNAPIASLVLTARALATELENDNPRFDRDRFLKACGVA